jgi:hypothetical protein
MSLRGFRRPRIQTKSTAIIPIMANYIYIYIFIYRIYTAHLYYVIVYA